MHAFKCNYYTTDCAVSNQHVDYFAHNTMSNLPIRHDAPLTQGHLVTATSHQDHFNIEFAFDKVFVRHISSRSLDCWGDIIPFGPHSDFGGYSDPVIKSLFRHELQITNPDITDGDLRIRHIANFVINLLNEFARINVGKSELKVPCLANLSFTSCADSVLKDEMMTILVPTVVNNNISVTSVPSKCTGSYTMIMPLSTLGRRINLLVYTITHSARVYTFASKDMIVITYNFSTRECCSSKEIIYMPKRDSADYADLCANYDKVVNLIIREIDCMFVCLSGRKPKYSYCIYVVSTNKADLIGDIHDF